MLNLLTKLFSSIHKSFLSCFFFVEEVLIHEKTLLYDVKLQQKCNQVGVHVYCELIYSVHPLRNCLLCALLSWNQFK